MLVWVSLAVCVLLSLSGYAAYLFYQIKRRKTAQEAGVAELLERRQKSQVYARDSIVILLRGLLQDQVTLTEVAIRVTGLVQVFDDAERSKYAVFERLANEASHIPINEAWKALSKKQKRVYEKEREGLEAQYMSDVRVLAEQLLDGVETSAPVVQMFEPPSKTVH